MIETRNKKLREAFKDYDIAIESATTKLSINVL